MKKLLGILLVGISVLYAQDESTCIPGQLLNSCQLFNTWKNSLGKPILVTAANKYDTPLGTRICARKFNISYARTHVNLSHPTGQSLFPSDGSFAQQLNDFFSKIQNNDYFLVYFSRIHLIILHELYSYLTKIFTSLNMTHVDSISEYVANESTQALNKKTLIINHLVTLIEAQVNQSILARFPALPKHIATNAGFTMMKHDYGADLDLLIEKQESLLLTDSASQQIITNMRSTYLDIFGSYLKFFNSYGKTVDQPDATYGSRLIKHAYDIQKILEPAKPVINTSSRINAATLREIKMINPPLFFYDDESIRAIRIISNLIKVFPSNVQKIPWPQKVVDDARNPQPIRDKNGIAITNQPAAYFLDQAGEKTTSVSAAKHLFVNIPTLEHMYSQELLPQPNWLNSPQGILLMVRACLGDFFVLLDPVFDDYEILDPCIRCIIANAAIKAKLMEESSTTKKICEECEDYITALRKQIKQTTPPDTSLPPDVGA